mmetsp:Transcript_17200/g.30305  ORF Transcript_17200/g.30305 Transcript_17200/m.30305 type:complete len:242 (+) Transcript_17200:206-931(+)
MVSLPDLAACFFFASSSSNPAKMNGGGGVGSVGDLRRVPDCFRYESAAPPSAALGGSVPTPSSFSSRPDFLAPPAPCLIAPSLPIVAASVIATGGEGPLSASSSSPDGTGSCISSSPDFLAPPTPRLIAASLPIVAASVMATGGEGPISFASSSSPNGGGGGIAAAEADAVCGASGIASIIPIGGGGLSPSPMSSGPADGIVAVFLVAAFSAVESVLVLICSGPTNSVVWCIIAAGGSVAA